MKSGIVIALAVLLLAGVGVYWAFRYFRQISRRVESLREKLRLTELQLLQAQVNPHFLYNVLDVILWLVEADRKQDAVHMLEQLSLFFRTSLSKGEDIIPLKEEIKHTRSYMEIQQARFRDIMEYEIILPKDLEEFCIPKLTIQPLVENALYHGVKQKRGKSMIRVVCREQEADILIIVEDNGSGMKPERKMEVEQALNKEGNSAGFGLAAVHERIRLYFGETYGVKIFSKYGEGTRIEVRISKSISFRKEEEKC